MLHSICQQIWKIQQWPQDWKRSVFIPIPKKGNAKECSNYHIVALISHASKIMHKILQARLRRKWGENFQMYKHYLEKAEKPEIKSPTPTGSWRKQGSSRKTSTSASLTTQVFDYVDHNKLWKILKEMGVPDHLTCLLRNLCAGQQATVRTGHGTSDWFQTGKVVQQICTLSLCLLNFHAEYIMGNAGLDQSQAEIKIPFICWWMNG